LTIMTQSRIVFRTDANHVIGTGHFVRCLTLADEMRRRGAHICFVSRDLPLYMQEMLTARGVIYLALPKLDAVQNKDELPHSTWLQTSQSHDAEQTLEVLGAIMWDWLVVDHYALDHRFETPLRAVVQHVLVIDDLADRMHDCDVLLDQNFYRNHEQRYFGKVPTHCNLLLGPSFALLRPEFKTKRKQVLARTGVVQNILVFFGGVDADNLTGQVLDLLISLNLDVQVNVVIGLHHPRKEKIQKKCEQHKYICHVETNQMAGLMAEADLAIGAGGSATWERCALGLPAIVIATAHHQTKAAEDLSEIGVSRYLGYWPELKIKEILWHLKKTIEDKKLMHEASVKSLNLVDGNGVKKVLNIILENYDAR